MKRETLPFEAFGKFIFLTPDLLLLPRPDNALLEIIKLPDPESLEGITNTLFRRIARLRLPKPTQLYKVHCYAHPIVGDTPQARKFCDTNMSPSTCRASRQYPFYPDPEQSIILLQICPRKGDKISELVLYRRTLLDAIEADEMWNGVDSDDVMDLPWQDWAFRSRWLYNRAGSKSLGRPDFAIYGQRLATVYEDGVTIKDFNPYAFMCAENLLAEESEEESVDSVSEVDEDSMRVNDPARRKLVYEKSHVRIFYNGEIYPGSEVVQARELPYVETTKASLAEELAGHEPITRVYMDGERTILTYRDMESFMSWTFVEEFLVFAAPQTSL